VASPFAGPVILVDTSVWVDHLRVGDALLARLLDRGETLGHPWVTGELALGNLREGSEVLRLLEHLPQATVATAADSSSSSTVLTCPAWASATSTRSCSRRQC
jgi:predicted nucleic acid-binding protein